MGNDERDGRHVLAAPLTAPVAAASEAESIRSLYLARDAEHQYERQWGYVNPAAAGYWRIRDELVFETVAKRFDVLTRDLKVLEVGVGHGHELAKFALLGIPQESLTGIDIVPERLARARQIYPAIRFEASDAQTLPFANDSFDVVCQFTCVMHAASKQSQERICREMSRVLRPGGIIIWWDVAPARWRVVVAQRLVLALFGPARVRTALRCLGRTFKELIRPRRRREIVAAAQPPYILPVAASELVSWFPGLKVRARRAGVDYPIWSALWRRHRVLANMVWRSALFSHHCFAVIEKN